MKRTLIFEYEHWVVYESTGVVTDLLRWDTVAQYTVECADGGILCSPPSEVKINDQFIAVCCSKCGELMSKQAFNVLSGFLKLVRTSR